MRKWLEAYLPKGGAFLDIGANEGYSSVIAAKLVGDEGQVVAIEPQDRLQGIIQENCRLNSVRNVTVLQTAVSDKSGEQDFYESPSTNTGSSSLARSTRYPVKVQRTSVRTLAEIMDENRMNTVDLLKMDIEGFEYEAVIGAQEGFREKRVLAFALELHPAAIARRGLDYLAITNVLEQNEYILTSIGENSIWVPAP